MLPAAFRHSGMLQMHSLGFLNRQPGTVLLYRAVCFCFFWFLCSISPFFQASIQHKAQLPFGERLVKIQIRSAVLYCSCQFDMLVYRQGKHAADGTRRPAARTGAAAFHPDRRHEMKTNEKENTMSKLVNELYKATRKLGKTASVLNDIENISKGNLDKVIKKKVKREIHKELNKKMK